MEHLGEGDPAVYSFEGNPELNMTCTIASNNIADPQFRESVNRAITEGVGDRSGDWRVVVYKAPDCQDIAIRMLGPNGLRWDWTLRETEQTPEFVRERVAQGILTTLSLHESSA